MLYYKKSSSIISHYFISYSKYRPLPLTVQGGPIGLVGWKKIILASSLFDYFSYFCIGLSTHSLQTY